VLLPFIWTAPGPDVGRFAGLPASSGEPGSVLT